MCNECKFVVFFVVLGFSIRGSFGLRVGSGRRYRKMRMFFLDLQTLILREIMFYLKRVDRPNIPDVL